MFYDIGAITNRDIQLLYEYRILRQPSDNLTAITRAGEAQHVDELKWQASSRLIETYDTVYEAVLTDQIKSGLVPFLEFHPEGGELWKFIADFIDIEVTEDKLILYSTNAEISELPIDIYWSYSLHHINSMLSDIQRDLDALAKDYASLENQLETFKDTGTFRQRPEGLIPNLIKIENATTEVNLVDSLYRIMTAENSRLYVNLSQQNLDSMEHIINEAVEFRFLQVDHYVLDSFISPTILISGSGDLVLKNLKGQVVVTDWQGTLTVIDCPEVHIAAKDSNHICLITTLQISRNSTVYLENYIHQIQNIELYSNSICRHWRANVRNISYIGPGCTYWCCAQVAIPGRVQLDEYLPDSNTVFDFNVHDVLGTFCSDFDNMLIVAQHNLTPRLGNSDMEPSPSICVSRWSARY